MLDSRIDSTVCKIGLKWKKISLLLLVRSWKVRNRNSSNH